MRKYRTAGRGPRVIGVAVCVTAVLAGGLSPAAAWAAESSVPQASVKALERIVLPGADLKQAAQDDAATCLRAALEESGISSQGLATLAKYSGSDLGAAAGKFTGKRAQADAKALLGTELREATDDCAAEAVLGPKPGKPRAYPAAAEPPSPGQGKANRKAVFPRKKGYLVHSGIDLQAPLKSLLGSYAQTDEQREIYHASAACVGDLIYSSGFSMDSMKFIATGPALHEGSVAAELPKPADQKLWRSEKFQTALGECTIQARKDLAAQQREAQKAQADDQTGDVQ